MKPIDSDQLRETKQFRFFRHASYGIVSIVAARLWGLVWLTQLWPLALAVGCAWAIVMGLSFRTVLYNQQQRLHWATDLDEAQFVLLSWGGIAALAGLILAL